MSTRTRFLWPALVACSALLPLSTGLANDAYAGAGGPSRAALDFRIVIPPVLRVLEHSHPRQLTGQRQVGQRLVVVSTMRRGFCVALRLHAGGVDRWQVRNAAATADSSVAVQPAGDGWRVCTQRPGRYVLELAHEFDYAHGAASARPWPVQTDITAL